MTAEPPDTAPADTAPAGTPDAPEGPFVPDGFDPPTVLDAGAFRLEPLVAARNPGDLDAWTSSIDHIRATPGYENRSWPAVAFTLEENLSDVEGHERDFAARRGFTFSVLDANASVIGCVYFYPPQRPGYDVDVRSWVRASHAELDAPVAAAVRTWLAEAWPWSRPDYAARP